MEKISTVECYKQLTIYQVLYNIPPREKIKAYAFGSQELFSANSDNLETHVSKWLKYKYSTINTDEVMSWSRITFD